MTAVQGVCVALLDLFDTCVFEQAAEMIRLRVIQARLTYCLINGEAVDGEVFA